MHSGRDLELLSQTLTPAEHEMIIQRTLSADGVYSLVVTQQNSSLHKAGQIDSPHVHRLRGCGSEPDMPTNQRITMTRLCERKLPEFSDQKSH